MLRRIIASASVACLVVANANADATSSSESLPAPIEIANLAFDGQFTQWGIPSTYYFCTDVNNTMLIAQDLAYAYLLDIGYVDSLIAPTEGAPSTQGQAQVKGKDISVSQGQAQAQGQAQVKGKDVPVSQGQAQAQGQAQVKAKDVPVSQGQAQAQGQAQVKGKDVPVSQGQAQAQTQTQTQAQAKGKLISSQQNRPGIMRTDLDIRRFVDYTRALTDDEVMLVRENFDFQYLRDLNLQMRIMCGE
ncbi:MAG: hypothetical protein RJB13_766 [Pseudomonadota bacterium]|jgi:hypothetical protein